MTSKVNKITGLLILFSLLFLLKDLMIEGSFGQSSGCAVVEVGNPTGPKPACSNSSVSSDTPTSGTATKCEGVVASFGVEKKLLPIGKGRKDSCFVPSKIVMHTTWGITSAEGIYEYFASGSSGRNVGTQFVVGRDGKVLQMAETLQDKVEITSGIANYNNQAISIELGHTGDYSSKSQVPKAQYDATLNLVRALMRQYKIPLGDLGYTWVSSSNSRNSNAEAGIYGHYQLNPETKTDPGKGFMRDFRRDLAL